MFHLSHILYFYRSTLCHRRLRHRPMHLFSYRVRLRTYACGTGWLWVCLHFGIAASASTTCPRCDGASADHKPGLLHRDGVGVCITCLEVRADGTVVIVGLSVDAYGHIQSLVGEVLRQQKEDFPSGLWYQRQSARVRCPHRRYGDSRHGRSRLLLHLERIFPKPRHPNLRHG